MLYVFQIQSPDCVVPCPLLQGRFPNLERWFGSMEGRPVYAGFKSDYYTHAHDLPPQLGGERAAGAGGCLEISS